MSPLFSLLSDSLSHGVTEAKDGERNEKVLKKKKAMDKSYGKCDMRRVKAFLLPLEDGKQLSLLLRCQRFRKRDLEFHKQIPITPWLLRDRHPGTPNRDDVVWLDYCSGTNNARLAAEEVER
jgi:hypothetical protein